MESERSLRSERFQQREQRELRREVLIGPLAELGLVAMDGPNDPTPSLVVAVTRYYGLISSAGDTQIIMTTPE